MHRNQDNISVDTVDYTYEKFHSKINDVHKNVGISLITTDCFEETLLLVSNENLHSMIALLLIADGLSAYSNIIFDYISLESIKNCFNLGSSTYEMEIAFSLQPYEVSWVADFCFNSIIPLSANLVEAKEELPEKNPLTETQVNPASAHEVESKEELPEKVPITKMRVHTAMLFHPQFLEKYEKSFKSHSLRKIEFYQQESKSLSRTTQESIKGLRRAIELLRSFFHSVSLVEDQQVIIAQLKDTLENLLQRMELADNKSFIINDEPPTVSPQPPSSAQRRIPALAKFSFFDLDGLKLSLMDKKTFSTYEDLLLQVNEKQLEVKKMLSTVNKIFTEKYENMVGGTLDSLLKDIAKLSQLNKNIKYSPGAITFTEVKAARLPPVRQLSRRY